MHLLDLDLVGQHEARPADRSRSRRRTPVSLTPTSASALASSISFGRFSTCRSLSPRATNWRSRRMIWPARSACSAARSIASRSIRLCTLSAAVEQPAAAVQVAGNRGQRLVQFMRQGRRHLAHRGEARHVDQFRLQVLQPLLRRLPLRQVAHEAGEGAGAAGDHLADRKLHRKGRCRPCAARPRPGRGR